MARHAGLHMLDTSQFERILSLVSGMIWQDPIHLLS